MLEGEEEDGELDFLSQALPAIVRERQREERGAVVRCQFSNSIFKVRFDSF